MISHLPNPSTNFFKVGSAPILSRKFLAENELIESCLWLASCPKLSGSSVELWHSHHLTCWNEKFLSVPKLEGNPAIKRFLISSVMRFLGCSDLNGNSLTFKSFGITLFRFHKFPVRRQLVELQIVCDQWVVQTFWNFCDFDDLQVAKGFQGAVRELQDCEASIPLVSARN